MIPSDVTGINNFTADNTPSFPSANYGLLQNNIPYQFSRYLDSLSNCLQPSAPYLSQDFSTSTTTAAVATTTPQGSCISNNSTSDEAEDHHHLSNIIDERRKRRMISNRESARRSRMRKQRHLDELWSQVVRLRSENSSLIDKLNQVSESHDKVLQENAKLKEEASDLRQMLAELQLDRHSPYYDVPCNTAHLRAESSNQSITTITASTNLLH